MENEEKQTEKQISFIDKFKESDSITKVKLICLILTTIFLFTLVIECVVANRYLKKLVYGDSSKGFSVELKTTKSLQDVFPDIVTATTTNTTLPEGPKNYVINTESKKIHYDDCYIVNNTSDEKKIEITLTDEELNEYLNNGYEFCKKCGG